MCTKSFSKENFLVNYAAHDSRISSCVNLDQAGYILSAEESVTDLAVHDKEIASLAVALVVKSARKGVVSLCTEMACLLWEKKWLEEQLRMYKKQHSSKFPQQTHSNSRYKPFKKKSRITHNSSHAGSSSNLCNSNNMLTVVDVHISPNIEANDSSKDSSVKQSCEYSTDDTRAKYVSKEVLCMLKTPREEELEMELQKSEALLQDTRIELLEIKDELKRLTELVDAKRFLDNTLSVSKNSCHSLDTKSQSSWPVESKLSVPNVITRQTRSPVLAPIPLINCLCSNCTSQLKSLKKKKGEPVEVFQLTVKGKPLIEIGDIVLTHAGDFGTVKYIGHLDDPKFPALLYIGIELDEEAGTHNGCVGGKRYFTCPKNRGHFLPAQEIRCILQRQNPCN